MSVEQPTGSLVSPDVAIDSLVTDGELPQTAEMTGDLLWTPLPADQFVDLGKILDGESLIAAGTRSPTIGAFLGFARPVATIYLAAIATDLA